MGSKKAFPPRHLGRKATLPRYHPHSRSPALFGLWARTLSFGNGGRTPSRSRGPLPGEPSGVWQGGFQPMTAPLLGTDAPLFSRSTHFKLTILISQNPPFGKGKFLNWENGRKKARFCPRSRQHVPPPCWTRAFSGGKIGYSRRGRLRPGSPGYTTTKYRRFFAA